MRELKNKLEALCIFRSLLKDPVVETLFQYLEKPSTSAHAGFVAALYEANGGNLSGYEEGV